MTVTHRSLYMMLLPNGQPQNMGLINRSSYARFIRAVIMKNTIMTVVLSWTIRHFRYFQK